MTSRFKVGASLCPPESGCHNDTEARLAGHDERSAAQTGPGTDHAGLIQKRLDRAEQRVPVGAEVLLVEGPVGLHLQVAPSVRIRNGLDAEHQRTERDLRTEQRTNFEPVRLRQVNRLRHLHHDPPVALLGQLDQAEQVHDLGADQFDQCLGGGQGNRLFGHCSSFQKSACHVQSRDKRGLVRTISILSYFIIYVNTTIE